MTGNKGEWSEVYALLKVLYDGQLNAGDENLNKIGNLVYPIIEVLRDESNGTFRFSYDRDIVIVCDYNKEEHRISIEEIGNLAKFLLKSIQESDGGAFEIPEIKRFLNGINSNSITASSSSKTDIKIIIHDERTGHKPLLGFSIKSQLGGASTLLNASGATNFIYEIVDLDSEFDLDIINAQNGRSKIRDRVNMILDLGCSFKFHSISSGIFQNNLVLIDSGLPEIMAEMLLTFNSRAVSNLVEVLEHVKTANPLNFNLNDNHPFYDYKVKKLLTDIALGMMPASMWDGKLDATGGYLIVKNSGDILCYHIYNRNEFEDYLLSNTRFETPSSRRHGFGELYKEGDKFLFKLNLQIRFLK